MNFCNWETGWGKTLGVAWFNNVVSTAMNQPNETRLWVASSQVDTPGLMRIEKIMASLCYDKPGLLHVVLYS
jgi:hypothetical protein